MRWPHRWRACALAWALGSLACSPALNWREVPLQGLSALLPCKPEQAQRPVQLGSQNLQLQVSGCEAAGALFAVSHLQVTDPAQIRSTQHAWRQATYATLQVVSVHTQPLLLAKPQPGQTQVATAAGESALQTEFSLEILEGKRPDGSSLQAQLAWLVKGPDVYLVAVFGPKLNSEMTELLFSELRLQ